MGLIATLPRASTADRRYIVGASDVAAIMGVSPWSSPMAVWLRMTQQDATVDAPNAAMRRGNHLEAGVRSWTAEEVGATEIEPGIPIAEPGVVGPEPWMAYHPDGAYLLPGEGWAVAELKTTRRDSGWGPSGSHEIPEHYALQVAWQLACTPQVDRVIVGVYVASWDEVRTYRVDRDAEVERWLVDQVGAWYWRHIALGEAPPIDGSSEARAYLARRHPRGSGQRIDADPEQRALALAWRDARRRAAEAEAEADGLANRLRATIGDASTLALPEGRISLVDVAGAARIDSAALRAEHPEIAQRFERRSAARRDLRWASEIDRRRGGQ